MYVLKNSPKLAQKLSKSQGVVSYYFEYQMNAIGQSNVTSKKIRTIIAARPHTLAIKKIALVSHFSHDYGKAQKNIMNTADKFSVDFITFLEDFQAGI